MLYFQSGVTSGSGLPLPNFSLYYIWLCLGDTGTFGHLSATDLMRAHPELVAEMNSFDPVKTAGTFGGLLLEPRLQANCLCLEALVHLAMVVCNGKRKPGRKQIQRWFRILDAGRCGMLEDPAEDVFVSNIETSIGNFRIVEGLAESSGFYLQRLVHLVEEMHNERPFSILREGVFALLSLSDAACERVTLTRYQLGKENKQESVPVKIAQKSSHYRGLVRFTADELAEHGIEPHALNVRVSGHGLGWDDAGCVKLNWITHNKSNTISIPILT